MATTPVVPPAPALFSIRNCWPRRAESRSAKMRASTSVLPPAANGTNTETGLVGHASWAKVAAPLDEFLQIFRRPPVGSHEFGTDLLQLSSHARRLHDTDRGVVQPLYDCSRRAFGQEEAIPEEGFEAGQALLLRGGEVRQNGRS